MEAACPLDPSSEANLTRGGAQPSSEADLTQGGAQPSSEANITRGGAQPSSEADLTRGGGWAERFRWAVGATGVAVTLCVFWACGLVCVCSFYEIRWVSPGCLGDPYGCPRQ
jgi:hypothetical protein